VGLSWSTFLIEIVNFVVLVWLLTRFLYRPITQAIATRRATITKDLERAHATQSHGEALEKQYQDRLVAWETEKATLRAALDQELGAARAARETALQDDLARMREREEAAAQARDAQRLRELERRAEETGAAFCARLLARIASPEVESRIVDAALADLAALPEGQRASLTKAASADGTLVVATRYPLDDARRAALTRALTAALGTLPQLRFEERDELVAGMRIDLGAFSLDANVADELQWFAQQ